MEFPNVDRSSFIYDLASDPSGPDPERVVSQLLYTTACSFWPWRSSCQIRLLVWCHFVARSALSDFALGFRVLPKPRNPECSRGVRCILGPNKSVVSAVFAGHDLLCVAEFSETAWSNAVFRTAGCDLAGMAASGHRILEQLLQLSDSLMHCSASPDMRWDLLLKIGT